MTEPVTIFFSLAAVAEDRALFDKLQKQLIVFIREKLIAVLHDSLIQSGENVQEGITGFMNDASVIVLLLSPDFWASEQCTEVELRYALERKAQRASHIIPVLLRPVSRIASALEGTPILPDNGRAISLWNDLDEAFAEVANGIFRIAHELIEHLAGTPPPAHPPQETSPLHLLLLPYRKNPFFTNREELLATIRATFISQTGTGETRIQSLHGLGGMGKTHLAVEYVHNHLQEYQAVFWLHTTPSERFQTDLIEVAEKLALPARDTLAQQQRIRAIFRWLERHERWLIVLDGVEADFMLTQLIPLHSKGHVLVISSAQALPDSALAVQPLTLADSTLLLLRRAHLISSKGTRADVSEEIYLQAQQIAQEFEGYPLALDQAGAYIQETRCSLESYLAQYRRNRMKFLERRGREAQDHPNPVTNTLSLALINIKESHSTALELLRFFAFLHPDLLPNKLFFQGAAFLSGTLRTLALDEHAFYEAIATLYQFSLLQQRPDSTTHTVQRIVQLIIRQELTRKQRLQFATQAVRLINATFPEVQFKTWKLCERYLLQAQHCATLIQDFQLALKEGGLLLERLGSYYLQRGCYSDAERVLIQARDLQEKRRRADPLALAQTLNTLGLLYQQLARHGEAEALQQDALKLRERALPADHPKIAESLHNLAMAYGDRGEYQRAEQLYRRVLTLEEKAKGPADPDCASTLNNLGQIYVLMEDYAQAEQAYQRALAIYEAAPDYQNHPHLIYPLDGLGAIAEAQEDYPRAEELYQRVLALCEQTFGDTHAETAQSLNKLADVAEAQGKDQRAGELYERALSIAIQALGEEHPDVALILNNQGFLAQKQGQYQQAEVLYQRALHIYEQALGTTHPDVVNVRNNLEQLFKKMRDNESEQDN